MWEGGYFKDVQAIWFFGQRCDSDGMEVDEVFVGLRYEGGVEDSYIRGRE